MPDKFWETVSKVVTRENIMSIAVAVMLGWIIFKVPGKLDIMIAQQATMITKMDQFVAHNNVASATTP